MDVVRQVHHMADGEPTGTHLVFWGINRSLYVWVIGNPQAWILMWRFMYRDIRLSRLLSFGYRNRR